MTKKIFHNPFLFLIVLMSIITSGCIHEYPDSNAVDPSAIEAAIELEIDMKWEEDDEEQPAFSNRARTDANIRITTEIRYNGEVVGRDISYPDSEEMAAGKVRRKLPFSLHALYYEIAVWCDYYDALEHTSYFNAIDLSQIKDLSSGLDWSEERRCGYASDVLDLRQYKDKWNAKVIKELSLSHAGARFKLITTDMRKFVEKELNSIENGETYTLTINYSIDTADGFDAFSGAALRSYKPRKSTGPLLITYNIYGDEEIAEGFVFCNEEDKITAAITVNNSARMTVVKTPEFSFKVKRGMISIVTGEFLSEMFFNHIRVDNVWEGEITIDI